MIGEPDLLVIGRDDVGEKDITALLSPSTRAKDLLLKRGLYEDGGVASYWVVDPDEPSVTVLELVDGRYRLPVALPFPVEQQPDLLLG